MRLALELIRDVGLLGGTAPASGPREPRRLARRRSQRPVRRPRRRLVGPAGDADDQPHRGWEAAAGDRRPGRRRQRRCCCAGRCWRCSPSCRWDRRCPGGNAGRADELAARRAWSDPDDRSITAIWAEAGILGVLAQGAVSPVGTALLERRSPGAAESVAAQLLAPGGHCRHFRFRPHGDGCRLTVRRGQRAAGLLRRPGEPRRGGGLALLPRQRPAGDGRGGRRRRSAPRSARPSPSPTSPNH